MSTITTTLPFLRPAPKTPLRDCASRAPVRSKEQSSAAAHAQALKLLSTALAADESMNEPQERKFGIDEMEDGTLHSQLRETIYGDLYTADFPAQSDGTYKIYIPDCPDDPYGKGAVVHHRYEDGSICVLAGKEPRSLDRAKAIAMLWMERYSQYIRSGVFKTGGARVNV